MGLSITQAEIKEKAGITVADYDAQITNLIDEWTPVIEFAIEDQFLADTGNVGLQATLNLGARELIAGEFLAQLLRSPGAADEVRLGSTVVKPAYWRLADPHGLKSQGLLRLGVFLKPDTHLAGTVGVVSGGDRPKFEVGQ